MSMVYITPIAGRDHATLEIEPPSVLAGACTSCRSYLKWGMQNPDLPAKLTYLARGVRNMQQRTYLFILSVLSFAFSFPAGAQLLYAPERLGPTPNTYTIPGPNDSSCLSPDQACETFPPSKLSTPPIIADEGLGKKRPRPRPSSMPQSSASGDCWSGQTPITSYVRTVLQQKQRLGQSVSGVSCVVLDLRRGREF